MKRKKLVKHLIIGIIGAIIYTISAEIVHYISQKSNYDSYWIFNLVSFVGLVIFIFYTSRDNE